MVCLIFLLSVLLESVNRKQQVCHLLFLISFVPVLCVLNQIYFGPFVRQSEHIEEVVFKDKCCFIKNRSVNNENDFVSCSFK